MPDAAIRDFTAVSYSGTSTRSVSAPTSRDRDVLLIIHSADIGNVDGMAVTGGGTWETIATRPRVGGAGGTKVYRRVATSAEPSSYQLAQSSGADVAVAVLAIRDASAAGIVVTQAGAAASVQDVTTPPGTPSTGAGLELRYAAAFSLGSSTTLSWQAPTGWAPVRTLQSRQFVSTSLASRPQVSSTTAPAATFHLGRTVGEWQGITILVPTAGSVPTPPAIPEAAPIRGSGLYRYTVHDFPSGTYRGDIRPTGVTFDRRILESGTFSGTLPIPNRRIADQVAQIIPRFASDLSTGPGRITVRIWRAGQLWGEYWITGAQLAQNRRGNVSIQLRGSTLEAYLGVVPIETSLSYSGDQIANARSLLSHMQTLSGANLGLRFQPGTSEQSRPLEVKLEDDPFYGAVLNDYARQYNGFEWTIDPVEADGVVERWWRWGYPTITSSTVHVVSQSPTGGDLLEWGEEIDALRGATRVRVRGGTPEVEDAEEGAEPVYSSWQASSAHMAAGWPRIGQRIDHPGESTSMSELNSYAQRWIRTFAGAVRVYSCTVALGAKTTLSPSALGDQVRRVMINAWFPRVNGGAGFNVQQRLIGISITPVSRETGKEEAQLVLEEPSLPATSGDRYPAEQRRVIRRLERDVDRLSTDAKTVKGVPVPAASDVPNPPNFTSPSTQTGDFASADAYNKLRADAAALHDTVRDALNSFRAKGFLK